MRSNKCDLNTKEFILKDIFECVSLAAENGTCEVHTNAPIIISLNRALRCGLRDGSRGYWHIVQLYTHSSEINILNKFFNPTFSHQEKAITWLCYTLVEGSLLSYISSLLLDTKALHRFYLDTALLRDHELTVKFISFLHKLSTVILSPISDRMADEVTVDEQFNGNKKQAENHLDAELQDPDIPECESASFVYQKSKKHDLNFSSSTNTDSNGSQQNHQLPPPMTSSVLSLASPVDSGVALIDSDFDNTSVSEVTLDNDKNEDDLPFTNMEESGIIWGESLESQPDSVANSIVTQIYNDNMPFEYSVEMKDTSYIKSFVNDSKNDVAICTILDNKSKLAADKKISSEHIIKGINSECEDIVFRRTRGRKTKKDKAKCVSFNEDSSRSYDVPSTNGVSKRFSINESFNGVVDNKTNSDFGCLVRNEPFKLLNEETSPDNVSTLLDDSEIGVEVECESTSSTVTDVSTNKTQGLYKKCQHIIKERFESLQSRLNRSEPEIFHGSTSSLISNSSNYESIVNSTFSPQKTQQKSVIQKRHSLGSMFKSIKGQWLIPVSERGVPEGQEDPQKICSSVTNLNEKCLYTTASSIDLSSESEWSSEAEEQKRRTPNSTGHKSAKRNLWPSRNSRESLSKTSLMNRFLQSIPEKKVKVNLALNRRKFPIYFKGVKPDTELSKQLLNELEDEMKSWHVEEQSYSVDIDDNLHRAIHSHSLQSPLENIYKIYKVSSLEGLPLLCILTNTTLYISGISPINQKFFNHHIIPYSQMNSVIVGPNSQVMMLAVTDKSSRVSVLTTLGQHMVNELIGHLEIAVRRALGKPAIAIRELTLKDMTELKRMLVKQSSVHMKEELEHYVWVNIGDSSFMPASNPLGPTKSGHLMFRPHKHSSWLPGYVLLKSGVLYVFADANQRLPNHAVPLHSGQCCGCRRVPHPMRPHTFEIILPNPGGTFQLAAADEYEVSDWLQAFVQAASGDSDSDVIHDELSEAITGCGLLLTTNHILTISFPYKVMACAQLQNIVSIKLAFNCCVLETGCREISEGCGDWVVYFATDIALEEFLTKLVELQPSLTESICMMSESDPLNIRCEQTSRLLEESWQLLLNPQLT